MFKKLFKLDNPSNKKNKRISIYIEPPLQQEFYYRTNNDNTNPMVLVRGTREKPGIVQATVTLEIDSPCEGDEVEIQFRAVIGSKIPEKGSAGFTFSISEQVLQKKRWILPVTKLSPHVIAAGRYCRQVDAVIDSSWPSSCMEHAEGFVQYSFQAQIIKMSATKVAMPLLSMNQEFLVLNLNNTCENFSNYKNLNQHSNHIKSNFHGKENYGAHNTNSYVSNIGFNNYNKYSYSNSCLSNIGFGNFNKQSITNSYISNANYNKPSHNSVLSDTTYNSHHNVNSHCSSLNSNISYPLRTKHSLFMIPSPTVGVFPASLDPHSISVLSPKKSVPMEMSIPSDVLVFGQRVPITITVNPFNEWTSFAGQEVVVMDARFGIEQTRHARSANRLTKDKICKDYIEVSVPGTCVGSWPQSRNGWKRTVNIKLPAATGFTERNKPVRTGQRKSPPLLTPSLRSLYYDISHKLIVSLKIRTSGERDKQSEDIELQLDFQVVHPAPDMSELFAEYQPIATFSFECDEIPLIFDQTDTRQEKDSRLLI